MTLTRAEIDALPDRLPAWSVDGKTLVREFTFPGFPDAIAFVTRLAFEAEASDHHPDLRISYRRVVVSWTTHSADGLTSKDVNGAERTDELATRWPIE